MIRIKRLGIIREVETQAEADRFTAMGYEMIGETSSEQDVLEAHTIAELKELCAAQNIAFPGGNVSKKALIALLVAAQEGLQ